MLSELIAIIYYNYIYYNNNDSDVPGTFWKVRDAGGTRTGAESQGEAPSGALAGQW